MGCPHCAGWTSLLFGLAVGCASAKEPEKPTRDTTPSVGESPAENSADSGTPLITTADASLPEAPTSDDAGAPFDFSNPFLTDWLALERQADDPDNLNQCVGFVTSAREQYRSYTPSDPNANPKEQDSCNGAGNTAAEDGSCNVPCGFESQGIPIGNKHCSCVAGIFSDCGCSPVAELPSTSATSCDDEFGAFDPTLENGDGTPATFAEQMDETPCTTLWQGCVTPDLPAACEWTTPRGCLCLPSTASTLSWQCGSTNDWFRCAGDDCPAAFREAGVVNGDIKSWCAAGGG